MILYANGCSHTAAAEAVVPDAFCVDDGRNGIDRRPHPENLRASWCSVLATKLGRELICHAESGSSNDRILRTTEHWISENAHLLHQTLMIIQWTTWEREEWLHTDGIYYQVNASGQDYVPAGLVQRYKHYVANHDYHQKTQEWHGKIWQLHRRLMDLGINHLMYNGWSTFSDMPDHQHWGPHYIGPYDQDLSYNSVLIKNGYQWVNPRSFHFGANGHCFWAEFVLQYMIKNNMISPCNIS